MQCLSFQSYHDLTRRLLAWTFSRGGASPVLASECPQAPMRPRGAPWSPVRPAAKAAGYGCQARRRGLYRINILIFISLRERPASRRSRSPSSPAPFSHQGRRGRQNAAASRIPSSPLPPSPTRGEGGFETKRRLDPPHPPFPQEGRRGRQNAAASRSSSSPAPFSHQGRRGRQNSAASRSPSSPYPLLPPGAKGEAEARCYRQAEQRHYAPFSHEGRRGRLKPHVFPYPAPARGEHGAPPPPLPPPCPPHAGVRAGVGQGVGENRTRSLPPPPSPARGKGGVRTRRRPCV